MSLIQAAVAAAPSIHEPALDARVGNSIDLHVARADARRTKWSKLEPRVSAVVTDAADYFDYIKTSPFKSLEWYTTPLPITRPVQMVPKNPITMSADQRKWAAAQSLAFFRICRKNTWAKVGSIAICIADPDSESRETSYWTCPLTHKYSGEFVKLGGELSAATNSTINGVSGPQLSWSISDPLVCLPAPEVFSSYYDRCVTCKATLLVTLKFITWSTGNVATLGLLNDITDDVSLDNMEMVLDCTMPKEARPRALKDRDSSGSISVANLALEDGTMAACGGQDDDVYFNVVGEGEAGDGSGHADADGLCISADTVFNDGNGGTEPLDETSDDLKLELLAFKRDVKRTKRTQDAKEAAALKTQKDAYDKAKANGAFVPIEVDGGHGEDVDLGIGIGDGDDSFDPLVDGHVRSELASALNFKGSGSSSSNSVSRPSVLPEPEPKRLTHAEQAVIAFERGLSLIKKHIAWTDDFRHDDPRRLIGLHYTKANLSLVVCREREAVDAPLVVTVVNWQSLVSLRGQRIYLDEEFRCKFSIYAQYPFKKLHDVYFIQPDLGIPHERWNRSDRPSLHKDSDLLRRMFGTAIANIEGSTPPLVPCCVCNTFGVEEELRSCGLCLLPYHAGCEVRVLKTSGFQSVASAPRPEGAQKIAFPNVFRTANACCRMCVKLKAARCT